MNGKEYLFTQAALIQLGKQLDTLNLISFQKCILNAQSTAPVLDPTLFKKAQKNLESIRRFAEAIQKAKEEFINVKLAVTETIISSKKEME